MSTTATESSTVLDYDSPIRLVPPPVLFFGALIAGLVLQRSFPFRLLPAAFSRTLGPVLAIAGLGLGGASVRAMGKVGTTPEPYRPTTALVTSGPFRYSRNPIYISMTLLYVGISMVANAVWPLLLLPSVLFALTRGMIEREEGYLERRFGDQYRQYKERVRRWF